MAASEMVALSKEGQQFPQFSLPYAHMGYTHVDLPLQMKICFGGLSQGPPECLQQFFALFSRDHLGPRELVEGSWKTPIRCGI